MVGEFDEVKVEDILTFSLYLLNLKNEYSLMGISNFIRLK